MLGDQVAQRSCRKQAGTEQSADAFELQEAFEGTTGEYTGEHIVITGAEEGEGCDQRAGARTGDDRKLRPIASLGPAVQKTGAERAVGAATDKAREGAGRAIAGTPQARIGARVASAGSSAQTRTSGNPERPQSPAPVACMGCAQCRRRRLAPASRTASNFARPITGRHALNLARKRIRRYSPRPHMASRTMIYPGGLRR